MIREASNINHVWALLVVEELIRLGVKYFCVSPGSRSTPFATAIARHKEANSLVHYDERGASFAALGYGKTTHEPAVWVTTSGTAVANGLPAVIEAHMEGVPLILLTADRPHELRQTGANQSINQTSLFAPFIKWGFDAPPPTTEIPPSFVLSTIDQAVHRSCSDGMGPVHLNWMFREPLAPKSADFDFSPYLSTVSKWMDDETPYTKYISVNKQTGLRSLTASGLCETFWSSNGVVIAGRLKSKSEGASVIKLATALGWPVYVDVSSQVRLGSDPEFGEAILLSPLLFDSHHYDQLPVPDTVIQFGKRPASKQLLAWIDSVKPIHNLVVDDWPDRIDPIHNVTLRVESGIIEFCTSVLSAINPQSEQKKKWLVLWQLVNNQVLEKLENYWERSQLLDEPSVARIVSEKIGEGDVLVVGNSMPVRDLNTFAARNAAFVHIITNRGASGIDGIIATAVGASIGSQKPVTVLIGDLSLLHDLNSLAMVSNVNRPFVVVVINNDGGGIFSFLPIAEYTDVFEPYFGTPHGLSFEQAADMFGAEYCRPETIEEFSNQYSEAINYSGFSLLEIRTSRAANLQVHKEIKRLIRLQ